LFCCCGGEEGRQEKTAERKGREEGDRAERTGKARQGREGSTRPAEAQDGRKREKTKSGATGPSSTTIRRD